ncbi:hypothetical protein [Carnimonas bestiolae]|uniref:hypothetical protein n=1 Tax=Carnimonas bestiolae TaxID=3402172 RepID=UPI003EDBAA61
MSKPIHHIARAAILSVGLLSISAWAADDMYYSIGGGSPVNASAGLGHSSSLQGVGIGWNVNATCGNFDMGSTVSNQLNGMTNGFQTMMGNVVQNATSAVASLPAMIIQRTNPGLYDLITNGVLQGRTDFDKAKLSCQNMANSLADASLSGRMQQDAQAENMMETAANNKDAVSAQAQVEKSAGNSGKKWVGGKKYGGQGQDPIRVVSDATKAGFNLLHGHSSTSTESISGGGKGQGSVSTSSGNWVGGGGVSGNNSSIGGGGSGGSSGGSGGGGGGCQGGMCTVWSTPQQAADWTSKVTGDTELRTCDGCEPTASLAGTGLVREVEEEQKDISKTLSEMVNGGSITQAKLNDISAGDLAVSRSVIEALRTDPEKALLTHRLASEMALTRTLNKGLWARRALIAGASEPGIQGNGPGSEALNAKIGELNNDIEMLRQEMEIRKSMSSSAAATALRRAEARTAGSMSNEYSSPDSILDNRGRPKNQGSD